MILTGLAGFVTASFLLLLNPRVIQVMAAVLPTPAGLRNKVDKLGAAVTAYSGNRTMLLAAVACGLCVHLGTCFMYFGTMMAIRAENTSLLEVTKRFENGMSLMGLVGLDLVKLLTQDHFSTRGIYADSSISIRRPSSDENAPVARA